MKTTTQIVQWIAVLLACAASSRATVIFDSFDVGGTFHSQDNTVAASVSKVPVPPGTNTIRLGVRFPVSCSDFVLTSVTLPISVQKSGTTDNVMRVRLTHDAGGTPGATIEVLSLNQGIWPTLSNPFTNKTTLYSAANPVLSSGSNYWIVTEPTAIPAGGGFVDVDHRWFMTTNGPQVSYVQQQAFGGLPSDPWSGPSGSQRLALRVEGMPTSTPNLSIRFSAVEVCWQSCSNAVYQVQYASELNTNLWINLGVPVAGSGSRLCVADSIPEGQPKRFYRLTLP